MVCAGILAVEIVYLIVMLFTTPSLVGSDPVLLEALRGPEAALIAGGAFARVGRASLVLALLVPIPALMMTDPFVWWAGRLWGPELVDFLAGPGGRDRRSIRTAMRLVERGRAVAIVVAPFLPIPSAIVYAAAGWTGMRFAVFFALDLLGTFAWIAVNVGLGYALGRPAVHVAHTITHYALLITIGLVVVSMVLGGWRAYRFEAARNDLEDR